MTRLASLALMMLVGLLVAPPALAQEDIERFTLDSGLRVTLWSVPSAKAVAVVTLFDIGERHDPVGASGTAHFLEHLLCTAATAEREPTTSEELVARYQGQFNAQTGEDYTLLAFVTPRDDLVPELLATASRLRDLRLAQSDLDRELPRVEVELRNMHGDLPILGLMNGAKQRALPMQPEARKGGVIEQIAAQSIDDLKTRLATYYGAANTRLVLVGGFDLEPTRAKIRELFADLPRGEPPPTPWPRSPRMEAPLLVESEQHTGPGLVCLAFPTPAPSNDRYAAAVLIASRLADRWPPTMNPGMKPSVQWTPLDQPEAIFVIAPIEDNESPTQAISRLDTEVRKAAFEAPEPAGALRAVQRYGMMLGATPVSPFIAAQNPYFAAMILGRGDQLDTPGPELVGDFHRVDANALRAAYAAHFSPIVRGASGITRAE